MYICMYICHPTQVQLLSVWTDAFGRTAGEFRQAAAGRWQ